MHRSPSSFFLCVLKMRPPLRRCDQELIVVEGRPLGGAIGHRQHDDDDDTTPATKVDMRLTSVQLGIPAGGGRPHAGRGEQRTQTHTVTKLKKKGGGNPFTLKTPLLFLVVTFAFAEFVFTRF